MEVAAVIKDAREWAGCVFGGCDLGDARRTRRLVDVAARQAADPEISSHGTCMGSGAMKEGTFRFLRNPQVAPEAIAEGGFLSTVALIPEDTRVLVVEDLTSLTVTHNTAEQLGDIGGVPDNPSRGYLVHSALAVDFDRGELLGLLDQQWWTRPDKRPSTKSRKKRSYEEKETYKWQLSSERIRARCSVTPSFVWVCDRGADVHEYLQHKLENGEHFVVRAAQNRAVEGSEKYLWDRLKARPTIGTRTVKIGQRGRQKGYKPKASRPGRTVIVEVRASQVTMTPKDPYYSKTRRPISMHAVLVSEPNPPDDVAPLEWMLLTTEPISTADEVEVVIQSYEWRWVIEEYHRCWKTGCRAEKRRLQSADNLQRLLIVLAFIGVRIMQLRDAFEATPDEPCDTYLSTSEWQCLFVSQNRGKPIPEKAPPMSWATTEIAKLAGWIDTKGTGRIGWLTLWKGWRRLDERLVGWEAAAAAVRAIPPDPEVK